MELWIRSQDRKRLIKVYNLVLNKCTDCCVIKCNERNDNILGVYNTEKRALEVLDEIQEAQLGNFHYKCPSNVKVSNKEDTIVYEMPKE